MSIVLEHRAWLWLLPLALLPWLPRAGRAQAMHPALDHLAGDVASRRIEWLLRACASVAIASLLTALAAPRMREAPVEKVVQGAEIVVLLDRSLSMDQPFGAGSNAVLDLSGPTKAQTAQRLLSEFARQRSNDLFGLVLFSTFPLPVLPFTQRRDAIESAIDATGAARALGDTDVGSGLLAAAAYFNGRPYAGSRVVMLISDGGAQLDPVARQNITAAYARNRITLYWLYIRSRFGPGLSQSETGEVDDPIPERSLHHFFRSLPTPYHLYEAQDAQSLRRAIADLGRLERAPLQLRLPAVGRDLRRWPLIAALGAALVLALASLCRVRPWPNGA